MKGDHFEWARKIRTNLLVPGMDANRSEHPGDGDGEGKLVGPCPAPVPRLRVDKPDGGLVVAGVEIGNSCQIALPISGLIFVIIGAITTVIAYQGQSAEEDHEAYVLRVSNSSNSRLLGPVCLSLGLLMLVIGGIIYLMIRYIRIRDQRVCYHCPIHGDFFPLTPIPVSAVKGSRGRLLCGEDSVISEPPSCPYSLLSARNSVSSQGSCPAPTAFIINNNSHRCAEYFWPLTVSGDIASFPATRTPSPTPINQILEVESAAVANSRFMSTVMPEIMLVAPARETSSEARGTSSPARGTSPTARGTSPAARETTPGARKTSPAARGTSPAAREMTPAARETSPAARGTSPAAREESSSEQTECTTSQQFVSVIQLSQH